MRFVAALVLVVVCADAFAQDVDYPLAPIYGNREIDKLPKSKYAESLWGGSSWYWNDDDEPEEPVVGLHLKPSFRVGPEGMERLCVVEAATPGTHRQSAWLRFRAAGGDAWASRRRATWLGPKRQYRACWLPVLAEPIEVALTWGNWNDAVATAQASTADGAPEGLFEVDVSDEPVYVDHGYGLMPAWCVMAHAGQTVRVRFAAGVSHSGPVMVTARLVGDQDEPISLHEWSYTPASLESAAAAAIGIVGRPVRRTSAFERTVATDGLKPGTYTLRLTAALPNGQELSDDRTLLVVEPGRPPGFGAHYTDLRYADEVYVSREERRSWDGLWEGSNLRDVVVTFPGSRDRFVFWRGTSYVPCWAFNNSWLTYEWLESEPDYAGAVGCVEPIMDKGCKHSRVRIVSATDARVIIHWRYALTDFEQKIIRDEWADEYYCFYPDAVGTRKLVAWIKSGWHENQEFIALNRPGNAPHVSVEPQAVTFLATDGRAQRPVWPRPLFSVDGWPHIIAQVNIPGQASPFMVVDDGDVDVKVWSDPYVDKPGLFNTYIHWPVSRGIRTTWLDDPADWHRPTHSNLVNVVNRSMGQGTDHEIWAWLIGVSSRERDTRTHAACWLSPGAVTLTGGQFVGYDKSQRAYVIDADAGIGSMTLTVRPDGAAIVNPAFLIRNANSRLSRADCPGASRVATGRENGDRDFVVWVEGNFPDGLTLQLN